MSWFFPMHLFALIIGLLGMAEATIEDLAITPVLRG